MMNEHRFSNEIKSIRSQTSLCDSVSQSAMRHVWHITHLRSELHFCAESSHDSSY